MYVYWGMTSRFGHLSGKAGIEIGQVSLHPYILMMMLQSGDLNKNDFKKIYKLI